MDIIEKWKKLKKYPNVIGIDGHYMPKIRNGKPDLKTACIRIYVSKKIPLSDFSRKLSIWDYVKKYLFHKKGAFSQKDLIPSYVDGICTDIVEIGPMKALDNKGKFRPVCAGISTMHKDGTACTLNGFYKDKATGKVLIASNNHCYAMENNAKIGDEVMQPAPYDGGKYPEDVIGRLEKFVEVKFAEFTCPFRNSLHRVYRVFADLPINTVDIAFATIDIPYTVLATYIGQFKGKKEAVLDEKVQKTGRTTEHTDFGKIVSTSWSGTVQYSRGVAFFTDCILIEGNNFSAGGDSGSPVFDMNGNYLGALFAGSDTNTIVCKVKNIEELANVELILSES